jgi:glutathione synthase
MTLKLGVVMDPIAHIKPYKDTSLRLLQEARLRGYELFYMEQKHLSVRDGVAYAWQYPLTVFDDVHHWFALGAPVLQPLAELDLILMRKDPPFDIEYIYTTHILELAARDGVLVANNPQSLRDYNEKLATAWFPDVCPPSLVTRELEAILEFLKTHRDIVVKPLEAMGGFNVFRLQPNDPNITAIIENLTHQGSRYIMAQRYIPEIVQGDKRIFIIDGEPVPYALARLPAPGETRANLAAGGTPSGLPLSERDRFICQTLGPTLKAKQLYFVGIDVIGDYLTEINVTSPTGVRELETLYPLNIAAMLLEVLTQKIP